MDSIGKEQCGQVYPVWIRLGTIRWVGSPAPEPHYMITYCRCRSLETTRRISKNGFVGHFCPEHMED